MANSSDIYGQALLDYFNGCFEPPLLLHNSYGDPEEMPVEVFFREENDLPELEQYALHLCAGRVLDVGAGAGVHALILQEHGLAVTAIETSALACEVMMLRGVHKVENINVFEYVPGIQFDTLLLLMNGAGLLQSIDQFPALLTALGRHLAPGGKILIDSSDISYLYEGGLPAGKYFGEISYRYEYKNQQGPWFPWLYIDQNMLVKLSRKAGFDAQVIYENEDDQYLAVLKPFD